MNKRLKINALLLDLKNPRMLEARDQKEAIQNIIKDQGQKLIVLAKSIIERGLNPIDSFFVLKDKKDSKKYYVLEGNRRLAALQILNNPRALNKINLTDRQKKNWQDLASQFRKSLVEPISCHEVKSRKEANYWLELRHAGERGGEGIVSWRGGAVDRFNSRENPTPVNQVLMFIKDRSSLTERGWNLLENNFPITNLQRLVEASQVRKLIGFDITKEGKFHPLIAEDELIERLETIFLNIAHKEIKVSHIEDTQRQKNYIKKCILGGKPISSLTNAQGSTSKPGKRPVRKPRTPNPATRKMLIPSHVNLNIENGRIAQICLELRGLELKNHPNAISVLFRVFLELSVDHYLKKNGISLSTLRNGHKNFKSLDEKIGESLDHIKEENQDVEGFDIKDFIAIERSIKKKHSPLQIDLLHRYVHHRFTAPDSQDLKGAWDETEIFFEQLWQ